MGIPRGAHQVRLPDEEAHALYAGEGGLASQDGFGDPGRRRATTPTRVGTYY